MTAELGPDAAGSLMTPREFDRAEFEEGSRYELINGVLVVSPIPLESESDPNGELEYLLRLYRDTHPSGSSLNGTMPERIVKTKKNRRRPDRVIWAGLGRPPRMGERPTSIVEFVSGGTRSRRREYKEKRDEYLGIGVLEYWIIDRFQRTLTVFAQGNEKRQKRVVREGQVYSSDLLPRFELPLARLLAIADAWAQRQTEAD